MAKFYSPCTAVGQFLLCSWKHQLGHEWPRGQSWGDTAVDRGGQGTQGLLLHSAIATRTSFSWSVCNPWENKALAWAFLSSPAPKPWHCLSSHVVSGAEKSENRLHLALLEGAALVGQLEQGWHYKNQSSHRAALRQEMLSQMVCSSLGQKCSPAEEISQCYFSLFPVLVTDCSDFAFCQCSHKSVTTSLWK